MKTKVLLNTYICKYTHTHRVLSFRLRLHLEHYFYLPLVPTPRDRTAYGKTITKKRSPTWSQTRLSRRPNRGWESRSSAGSASRAPPPPVPTSPRWRAAGAGFRFRCEQPGRGGKMAAAIGVRGWCELPPCSGPGWLLSLSALLSVAARGAFATTHWVVTEDGKIQQQVAARASLSARARPRPGGFPGPAPGCLAPRGPAPSLPSHGPGAAARAILVLRPGVAPSPFVLWPSPQPPASS